MPNILIIIFQMILGLLIIIPAIYVTLKFGSRKFQTMKNGNYLNVIDKVMLSKDNSLLVIKIGEKAYIFSSTASSIEKLMEVDKEDIEKIINSKKIPEYKSLAEFYKAFKEKNNIENRDDLIKSLKNKLKIKKEG